MFYYPQLAKCVDRTAVARNNPLIGGPKHWLDSRILLEFGYIGLSFDFFIDWNCDRCQDEIWVKRISDLDAGALGEMSLAAMTADLIRCGDNLTAINAFAEAYGLDTYFQIFRDGVDWSSQPEPVLKAKVGGGGLTEAVFQTLDHVKDSIRALSGGPVRIGSKGLIYGTSSLECYLSRTDALWPGDVDCILWQPDRRQAVAILEFKKHTLDTPVSLQQLSNYYPRPDERKYKRLALLRDRLNGAIPQVVIYYPTNPNLPEIKLERIAGESTNLKSVKSIMINYRGKTIPSLGREVIRAVNSLLEGN